MDALPEVQAADALGFTRFDRFRRAVRRGLAPAPDVPDSGDGPRWSRATIKAWVSREQKPTDWTAEVHRRLNND